MGKKTDRQTEQRRGHSAERVVLIGTLMVSGCAQAPDAPVAVDYLAGVTSFDEVPVSEGTTVRTSERGVVVEERFTREIDPELVRAREARVRALVAEYREERDARDVLREDLASRGDAMVQITFNMPETGLPDISRLARENEVTRRNRIAERQLITSEAQENYVAELREVGAGAISQLWLTNAISTELPAREALEFWARHPEASVSLNGTLEPLADGVQIRDGLGIQRLIDAGFSGYPFLGGGPGAGMLAIIESTNGAPNWPSLENHPAFIINTTGGSSRIWDVYDCNACISNIPWLCTSWGCRWTSNRSTTNSHGNVVAHMAMGSIQNGTDPSVTNPTERRRRSGAAPSALANYFGTTDCDGAVRALQRAVEVGLDVANMSLGNWNQSQFCSHTANCSGLNEAIRNATNAGLVVVAAAGNDGIPSGVGCTIAYPAVRPEVIAVGALTDSQTRASYSSTGGPNVRYVLPSGTFNIGVASLGLMAFGIPSLVPQAGSPTFANNVVLQGTSFAAPIVAGTTLLMAQSMSPTTGSIPWPGQTISNMLLLGDAAGPSGSVPIGLSPQFGFGRMRASTASSAILTAPWGWGSRTITGGTGARYFTVGSTGPESPLTQEWRWVTASFENDLNYLTNDYTIRVADTCPPGGGWEVVAADESFDPRKRIQLNHDQICPPGRPTCRCLEMNVMVHNVGPLGLAIHSSDFFHSGDPNAF